MLATSLFDKAGMSNLKLSMNTTLPLESHQSNIEEIQSTTKFPSYLSLPPTPLTDTRRLLH
jgi:hypothetical protein